MAELYSKEMLEYFSHPGLNSTLLGKFADDPLVAVAKTSPKTYFEAGKAMERVFQDRLTGSKLFPEKFFICEDIKIPESFIDVYKSSDPLTSHFTYTKKGEFSKTKESLHDVIFQCLTDELYFGGVKRYPITLSDYLSMQISIDRLLSMEIELFDNEFYKLSELINDRTLWQHPVYWQSNGIKKKALYDMVVFFERKGEAWICPLDLKYVVSLSGMHQSFKNTRSRYILQGFHYFEGLDYVEEFEEFNKYPQMIFIVATKTDPFFVAPFMVSDYSLEDCYSEYTKLAHECDQWIKNGKPVSGIKKTIKKRIWIDNY